MKRVDLQPNIEHVDKVRDWRIEQLQRMFPQMPFEQIEELADAGDPYLLSKAARLWQDGCPHELAYLILL